MTTDQPTQEEMHGYHRSMSRGHGFEPLRAEGEVPDVIRGTLYRNGPALFEHGGRRHRHSFEGDGAVCAVRFSKEGIEGSHQLFESEGLRKEQADGQAHYGSAAPWYRKLKNGLGGRFKNTANTSIWRWQERMFGLMERGTPTEFDPETLRTIGTTTFDGLIASGFSAHPHRVHARRADYNFGLVPGRRPSLQLFEFPWTGAPRVISRVELPYNVMLHDFIATEKHLIFFVAPVKLQLRQAILGSTDMEKLFSYDESEGTEIIVVPLDAPEHPVRFHVDAFWIWHFAGAHEQGEDLVVDYVRHPDFRSLGELDSIDRSGLGRLCRARLDLKAGTMDSEPLWDYHCEYPRVDPRIEGGKHSRVFLSTDSGQHRLSAVDTGTGKVDFWDLPATQFPSEMVVIPRGPKAPEGDGFGLSMIYDEVVDQSHVAILDTACIERGPVARVHLDHHVPMTFHGTWVDDVT